MLIPFAGKSVGGYGLKIKARQDLSQPKMGHIIRHCPAKKTKFVYHGITGDGSVLRAKLQGNDRFWATSNFQSDLGILKQVFL